MVVLVTVILVNVVIVSRCARTWWLRAFILTLTPMVRLALIITFILALTFAFTLLHLLLL